MIPISMNQSNLLILSNIPLDLSIREANIIFSLVYDDISYIEIIDSKIFAYFKNHHTCITTGKLLDNKFIFGKDYLPIKVDFNSGLNSPNQLNVLNLDKVSLNNNNNQNSISQVNQNINQVNPNISNSLNTRSRFVFSDPFANGAEPPSSIDLSEVSNQSFLIMEDRDRERDPWSQQSQITQRTPSITAPFDWNQQQKQQLQQQQQQQQLHQSQLQPLQQLQQTLQQQQLQLQPSTQASLTSTASIPNGSSDRRRTSSSFFNNPALHQLSNNQQIPLINNSNGILLQNQLQNAQVQLMQQLQQLQQQQQQLQQQQQQQQLQLQLQQLQVQQQQQQQPQQLLQLQLQPSSSQSSSQPAIQLTLPSKDSTQAKSTSNSPTNSSRQNSSNKDIPELSLLARVPPPANPADQNPPCNTLYVGNLPPDATEQELRNLFSPQKGFRRLSFRTKNQSGNGSTLSSHNHGPMCFVEFEDVAHATRALAELYGRTLARPNGGNGKGGIRLSFSKNPLGVRGPGNPRRSSTNPTINNSNGVVNTPNVASNQFPTNPSIPVQSQNSHSNTNIHNLNGVGNYGYLNFHNTK